MKGVLKHIYELPYFNESSQIHFFNLSELLEHYHFVQLARIRYDLTVGRNISTQTLRLPR